MKKRSNSEFSGANGYISPDMRCVNVQLHVVLCQSGGDTEGGEEDYGENVGDWD